jgi:hypothetical protein
MARNDFFVLCLLWLVGLLAVQLAAVDRCFGLGLHIFSRTRPHPLLHAAISTFVGLFVCFRECCGARDRLRNPSGSPSGLVSPVYRFLLL